MSVYLRYHPQSYIVVCCFFLVGLLYASSARCEDKTDDFDRVRQQYREKLLASSITQAQAKQLIDDQKPDGSWPSVDYTDKTRGGWKVAAHLRYVMDLVRAYHEESSKLAGDPELKQAILRGIDHWLVKQYRCPNWWYNEIGCPSDLADITFLMQNELSDEQLAGAIEYIKLARFGMTGQNSVWKAGIVFVRAMIEDDEPLARKARDIILQDLKITTAEGLQPDFSFHQHGPQQQFGNYGLAFASDMINWGLIWRGTGFALSDRQIELIRGYMLEGERYTVYQNRMDISSCGRQLTPGATHSKAGSVVYCMQNMRLLDPDRAQDYVMLRDEDADNALMPVAKYFYRSDYLVDHQPDSMFSVKMSSNRVIGTETCNSENMQGYFLGDGATYIYANGDEYDEIYPIWDWRHLPGVTCHQNPEQSLVPQRGNTNKTDFVGGMTAQDGSGGCVTMDYHRDGLTAKKSWMSFDGSLLCLGAAITSEQLHPVHTTINQYLLDGPVYVWIDGKRIEHPKGELSEYTDVQSVWHDGVAYLFPEPTALNLSTREQKGSWKLIRTSLSDSPRKVNVFMLWIDHGVKPQEASYAFIIKPGCELTEEIPGANDKFPLPTLVSNTPTLQSALISATGSHPVKNWYGVFHESGDFTTPIGNVIAVEQPCILGFSRSDGDILWQVVDPTQKLKQVRLGVNHKRVLLPQGAQAGSPVAIP